MKTAIVRPLTLAWLALAVGAVGSCSRHAELLDEPNTDLELGPMNPYDEAALVDLEVPFESPPYLACAERPAGDCRGPNDFPCDFGRWFNTEAARCQVQTGCRTNGWVVADMGATGCVDSVQMSEPNAEFAACLVEVLGAHRCPCGAERRRHFLGIANQPCYPGERVCGADEFPCPAGQVCESGFCVAPGGAAGSSG
jgi:hypothetical protein